MLYLDLEDLKLSKLQQDCYMGGNYYFAFKWGSVSFVPFTVYMLHKWSAQYHETVIQTDVWFVPFLTIRAWLLPNRQLLQTLVCHSLLLRAQVFLSQSLKALLLHRLKVVYVMSTFW